MNVRAPTGAHVPADQEAGSLREMLPVARRSRSLADWALRNLLIRHREPLDQTLAICREAGVGLRVASRWWGLTGTRSYRVAVAGKAGM